MRTVPDDRVELWAVDLARTDAELRALAALLSGDELRRAASMRIVEGRRRYMCTRAALRVLLARYAGVEMMELELRSGPYGKPALDPPAVRFNIAHSGELALIAVAARAEVGVDLELMRPRRDPMRVARDHFTATECDMIEGAPDPDRSALFYRLWVAKEAFVKATGRGLSTSLRSFAVALEPGPPRLVHVGGDEAEARRWSLEAVDVGAGYAAALVVEGVLRAAPVRRFEPLAGGGPGAVDVS